MCRKKTDYRLVGWEGNTAPLPSGVSENTAALAPQLRALAGFATLGVLQGQTTK